MSVRAFAAGVLLALWVGVPVALAQSVVVLEFSGDKKFAIRGQVVKELQKAGKVELVALPKYKAAAKSKKLKGPRAMTPKAVAQVSKILPFDAAVEGAVGRSAFLVRILDSKGAELWSKELPVSGGKLSPQNVKRLGAAIAAAAGGGTASPASGEEEPAGAAAPAVEEAPAGDSKPAEARAGTDDATASAAPVASPVLPVKGTDETAREVAPAGGQEAQVSEAQRSRRRKLEEADNHTETVVDDDMPEPEPSQRPEIGPRLVTVQLAGTTTWRSYCSRPGVKSCREYDALAEDSRPPGDYYVDFSPQVPYAGFGLAVEFFPLSGREGIWKGLGLTGGYSRGFSLTNVRVQPESSSTAASEVVSVDQSFQAQATYRYYFGLGSSERLPGYAGLRAGLAGRSFEVDPSAAVTLHGSHRKYPVVGLDVSVPLARLVRIEGSGSYFVNPKAGVEESGDYGTTVKAKGWSAEAGLAGDVWGPFGYVLRFKLASYSDSFEGPGAQWPEGGTAHESYSGLYWGASAHF